MRIDANDPAAADLAMWARVIEVETGRDLTKIYPIAWADDDYGEYGIWKLGWRPPIVVTCHGRIRIEIGASDASA